MTMVYSAGKENVFSRAYFHMKTMDAVVAFHQGFDGHIFLDNKGNNSNIIIYVFNYRYHIIN